MADEVTQDDIAKAANALYDHPTLRGHSVAEITKIAAVALDAAAENAPDEGDAR